MSGNYLVRLFMFVVLTLIIAPAIHYNPVTSFALAQTRRQVGDPCTPGSDCGTIPETPGAAEQEIYCGLDNICGGKGAYCLVYPNSAGGSDACFSGICKDNYACRSPTAVGFGEPCIDSTDCRGASVDCGIDKTCGGRGALCSANRYSGNDGPTGETLDCLSGLCRERRCIDTPTTALGGTCSHDLDCAAGTVFGSPVRCSPLGRCGGPGAQCYEFFALEGCVSGICSDGICSGPGPSPGLNDPEKRQLAKQRVFGELCPGNLVPCPVGETGYECVDIQNNLESCGGCLGLRSGADDSPAGIDCTALPSVDSVSCIDGACVIGGCSSHATFNVANKTCVASA